MVIQWLFQNIDTKVKKMKNNKSEYLIKLLDFIECDFDTFSDDVKAQAKKMFLDLAGVICAGAKNKQHKP